MSLFSFHCSWVPCCCGRPVPYQTTCSFVLAESGTKPVFYLCLDNKPLIICAGFNFWTQMKLVSIYFSIYDVAIISNILHPFIQSPRPILLVVSKVRSPRGLCKTLVWGSKYWYFHMDFGQDFIKLSMVWSTKKALYPFHVVHQKINYKTQKMLWVTVPQTVILGNIPMQHCKIVSGN